MRPIDIRKDRGITRKDLVTMMDYKNTETLRSMENKSKGWFIRTLSKYIKALGGHIEIHAVFGKKKYKIDVDNC